MLLIEKFKDFNQSGNFGCGHGQPLHASITPMLIKQAIVMIA
jgi:hypothetical protein